MAPRVMRWKAQTINGQVSPLFRLHILRMFVSLFKLFSFLLQDSSRPTSATTCSVVWRSSGLNVAPATGTAVTTGNQCAGQMGSSTKTCVRWRCLRAEMGHASSRSRRPSVFTVRNEQPMRDKKAAFWKRGHNCETIRKNGTYSNVDTNSLNGCVSGLRGVKIHVH